MLIKGSSLKIEHAMYAVDTIALELDLKFSLSPEDVLEIQVLPLAHPYLPFPEFFEQAREGKFKEEKEEVRYGRTRNYDK